MLGIPVPSLPTIIEPSGRRGIHISCFSLFPPTPNLSSSRTRALQTPAPLPPPRPRREPDRPWETKWETAPRETERGQGWKRPRERRMETETYADARGGFRPIHTDHRPPPPARSPVRPRQEGPPTPPKTTPNPQKVKALRTHIFRASRTRRLTRRLTPSQSLQWAAGPGRRAARETRGSSAARKTRMPGNMCSFGGGGRGASPAKEHFWGVRSVRHPATDGKFHRLTKDGSLFLCLFFWRFCWRGYVRTSQPLDAALTDLAALGCKVNVAMAGGWHGRAGGWASGRAGGWVGVGVSWIGGGAKWIVRSRHAGGTGRYEG